MELEGPFPWHHVLAGMHTGRMFTRPLFGEFDAVLTLASYSGTVDDRIRHRFLPLSYIQMDEEALEEAVGWAFHQVQAGRSLLVRSEGGKQRPALVIACVCLRLGATYEEAVASVRWANERALSDFRYRDLLWARAARLVS